MTNRLILYILIIHTVTNSDDSHRCRYVLSLLILTRLRLPATGFFQQPIHNELVDHGLCPLQVCQAQGPLDGGAHHCPLHHVAHQELQSRPHLHFFFAYWRGGSSASAGAGVQVGVVPAGCCVRYHLQVRAERRFA